MGIVSFSFNEGHQAVIETTRGLLQKIEPRRDELLRIIFEEQRYPDELWELFANAGLFGALVPEEYGGTGVGLLAMTLAMEMMAGEGFENMLALLTTMDTMAILRAGSEQQKRAWLPKLASGSVKMAFAVTEPDAGSNTFKITTTARHEDGVYRLSGQKAWITGADVADYILLVARTRSDEELQRLGLSRTHSLGLFLVDTKARGLELQAMDTMGVEGYRQFFVFLDNVEVPDENRIGEENQGTMALFQALNPERILGAATAIGFAEFALNRAVAYAKERRVFGDRPIGAYQGVQHPLARVKVMQEAARMLTYRAAAAFDQGLPHREVGAHANMAKYLASEVGLEAVERAIQTYGGNGFVKEHHLIQLLAPAQLRKTAPLNNEMVLNFIAEHVLGLPKSY